MTTRARAYQRRLRDAGLCQACRKPCDVNPRTGGPYERCPDCRAKYNARKLAGYYNRKK